MIAAVPPGQSMTSEPQPYISHADLGGQRGRGHVLPEPEGELFHADWEPRALALTLAMGATGAWNIDQSRSARETLPQYAELSYYQIWLAALVKLMIERGLVQEHELEREQALLPPLPLPRRLLADQVAATLARGSSTERSAAAAARFKIGQRVRTRRHTVEHHTRLPAYAHDKPGIVERIHGVHVFADSHALGLGEQAQWLYTVVFEGEVLWGDEAQAGLKVSVDAWESYLEEAP
jgi:nitrile hydratase subunit beta